MTSNLSPSHSHTLAAKAAYRARFKQAVGSGSSKTLAAWLNGPVPHHHTWITSTMVVLAAKQTNADVLAEVALRCEEKTMRAAVKMLFKKHEVDALKRVAELGDETIADDLMLMSVGTGDIGVMTMLESAYKNQLFWPQTRGLALALSSEQEQWGMFEHLVKRTPKSEKATLAGEILHNMIHSDSVSVDLVTQALAWAPKGQKAEELCSDLFLYAAKFGRTAHMSLLMAGAHWSEEKVASAKIAPAMVEAAQREHEATLTFLLPHVGLVELRDEFKRVLADEVSDGGYQQRVLRRGLDCVGQQVSDDLVDVWRQWFAEETLPMTQARLRAMRSLVAPMGSEDSPAPSPRRLRA